MMIMKKKLIIAVLATICVTFALFSAIPTRSADSPTYDPWLDVNDDGRVDMRDIGAVCNGFGQHGTPIEKASIEYDSGWINITGKCGQYFTITHNLNSTDLIVDITGKTTPSGGIHQKYLGLAGYTAGWSKTYGGTYDDDGCSVLRTSDGGYAIAGYTASYGVNGDVYLVKTDAAGSMLWNKTYGGTNNEYVYSMVQTADGGYAIAGYTNSFGAGNYDFYLVRTDSWGNMLWNKTYGGTSGEYGWSVVRTADGGFALAGYTRSYGAGLDDVYLVKTDSAGAMLWNKTYGGTSSDYGYSVVQTADEGYAIAGYTKSYGAGGQDVYLVKTDSSGNLQWNKTYGGTNDDAALGLVQTADGGYAIVGSTFSFGAGSYDFYLVRTGLTGTMLWNKTYGGTDLDYGRSIIQMSGGGYALAGYTAISGSFDFYLVGIDSDGNMLWSKIYGGSDMDCEFSVVQTGDGGFAIVGWTLSYGAGPGYKDVWLVKTDVELGLAWTDSDSNTIALYRGATDPYWNFVRVRIWKPKAP